MAEKVSHKLRELLNAKKDVFFDEIPDAIEWEFMEFITGKTIGKTGDRYYAYYHDFVYFMSKKRTS